MVFSKLPYIFQLCLLTLWCQFINGVDFSPQEREGPISILISDKWCIFGGLTTIPNISFPQGYFEIDLSTSWNGTTPVFITKNHTSLPPDPISNTEAVLYDNSLLIFGGVTGVNVGDSISIGQF